MQMMKYIVINKKNLIYLIAAMLLMVGCERELSDDAIIATFPSTGDIFTDSFVSMGSDFYFPFDGAKPDVFSVDMEEGFESDASIRIDVPNENDPTGAFAGAIFRSDAGPRDLSGFDALTFWAKASQGVTIGEFGFGVDFEGDVYRTATNNVSLSTQWQKIIIPIPDPSKLVEERGLFWFSAGTQDTGGNGYTFWVDEVQYESLGTVRLNNGLIFSGQDEQRTAFIGSNQRMTGLGSSFNLSTGQNIIVNAAPSYFEFQSDNNMVTGSFSLDNGDLIVPVIGTTGSAVITATLANTLALGSLTINAAGSFPHAPIPTRNAADVTSLFSDAYNNVPVRHYNGFFGPPPNGSQTTQGGAGADPNNVDIQAPFANGDLDNIINYTQLNFVSIGTYDTVPLLDVSNRTFLHIDINIRENVDPSDFIRLQLESGTGGAISGGVFTLNSATLSNSNIDGWVSIDVPLSSFPGFNDPANLGQLFFISDGSISDIWVDNVYFYN